MEATTVREGYELWRPNRAKASSKTTKAVVAIVLLASAALIAIITIGGWTRLEGAGVGIMSMIWAALYVIFALLVMRWNRGLLPVAAALAVIMAIFAAISAPDWFARDKTGLSSPALPEDLIGTLCIILIPVQILLIVVCMIGFSQEWHVEEERPIGGQPLAGEDDHDAGTPAPPDEADASEHRSGEAGPGPEPEPA